MLWPLFPASENIEKIKGPTYIRLDKGNLEYNSKVNYNIEKGFALIHSANNKKILIITTGYFCKAANEVSFNLNTVSVLNLFRFKNFDKKKFIKIIKKYKNIVIFDESSKNGGIVTILANIFIENKKKYLLYSVAGESGIAIAELVPWRQPIRGNRFNACLAEQNGRCCWIQSSHPYCI